MTENQGRFKLPKEIRNALIIGGIFLFTELSISGVPTWEIVYKAFMGAILTLLIELKNSYKIEVKKSDISIKKTSKGTVFFT